MLVPAAQAADQPPAFTREALPAAVAFSAVAKAYGAVRALDGIDLSIPTGSTVALLGPNGAGKSTAIGIMLGLADPDGGVVRTLGLPPRAAVASGRVGAMLQSSGLPVGARVGELVDFARALFPDPLARPVILDRAGLTALAGRGVETLSGGEAQRLRFALAIAGDPELVFLDEPTVAMDVEARRAFWTTMRRFAAEGRTVLFATHYLEEADQVADRVVVLHRGRIVADGTAAAIKAGVAGRTVRFTLEAPDQARLEGLPGVTAVEIRGADVTLRTSDADTTVAAAFAAGLRLRDLEVAGADLESAFLDLVADETG